jgi:predicted transcriptional regulator of viral defense system
MAMKNTILSKKDANLLENVIIRYGRIVSFDQLKEVFTGAYPGAQAKNRISILSKLGWLVRIKRGLYTVVTDIGSLLTSDISVYTMCQALNRDSYVSFENALQYHGMFDQRLSTVSAVTFKRARKYKVRDTEINFFKVKKELFFGFTEERSDIGLVNIARKEKALLDMLYFRSNQYCAGLVWEKLKEYKSGIDFDLMKRYAKKFNLDVMRQTGFFLDRIGVGTEDIRQAVSGKTSYSRMTRGSRHFNPKWRLYFDDSVIE